MAGADTLMTTTLPTIIGMGVTSKAVTTMFGKGKRGSTKATPKKGRTIRIYQGKRGGQYVIRRGRKIYI